MKRASVVVLRKALESAQRKVEQQRAEGGTEYLFLDTWIIPHLEAVLKFERGEISEFQMRDRFNLRLSGRIA